MKIKINNITWTVKFVSGDIEGAKDLDGSCKYCERLITIRTDFNRDYVYRVVIHELCHATLCSVGLGGYILPKFNQEQICEFMAYNVDNIYKNAELIMKGIK